MTESTDKNFKWAQLNPEKLNRNVDIKRLIEPRSMLIDVPLLPFLIAQINLKINDKNKNRTYPSSLNKIKSSDNKTNRTAKKGKTLKEQQTQLNLQPSIDSYIINTIKLNRILNNDLTFDQIEYFATKTNNNEKRSIKKLKSIRTDNEARNELKQFIMVMCIHTGFVEINSSCFEILVDLLESYVLSIFKILKNLQNIHQTDLNSIANSSLVKNSWYSSHRFTKQAFQELGISTIQDIKNFYLNDIINYHQDTYGKVSKLYEQFKSKKLATKAISDLNTKKEGESKVEQFIKENDILNDDNDSILGELLTNLNETHFDEEMNKLLLIIGNDPFALMSEEFQQNLQKI